MSLFLQKPAKLSWTLGCGLLFKTLSAFFFFSCSLAGCFPLFIFLFYSWKKCKFSFGLLPQSQQPDGTDWANVKQFNIIDDPYSFSFTGEFLPICDLKNMVSTSTKDFS
jgi:hypothetical protein